MLLAHTVLGACASTIRADYPAQLWGETRPDGAGASCRALVGRFADTGERAPHRHSELYTPPSLAQLLMQARETQRGASVTIAIRDVGEAVLQVSRNNAMAEIKLSPEQVRECSAGPLHIRRVEAVPKVGEGEGFKQATDLYLTLTGEGDLVVREHTIQRGWNFDVIRYRDTVDVWYRFRRAD